MPEAKVVRPLFPSASRPAASIPAMRPEETAAQAAVVADLATRRAPKPAEEAPKERFRRALELERAVEAGNPATPEQARWLSAYQATAEYRAERMLWGDFGDAYFG